LISGTNAIRTTAHTKGRSAGGRAAFYLAEDEGFPSPVESGDHLHKCLGSLHPNSTLTTEEIASIWDPWPYRRHVATSRPNNGHSLQVPSWDGTWPYPGASARRVRLMRADAWARRNCGNVHQPCKGDEDGSSSSGSRAPVERSSVAPLCHPKGWCCEHTGPAGPRCQGESGLGRLSLRSSADRTLPADGRSSVRIGPARPSAGKWVRALHVPSGNIHGPFFQR
jgi:hypothetical protein